jgi:hypothetical protein
MIIELTQGRCITQMLHYPNNSKTKKNGNGFIIDDIEIASHLKMVVICNNTFAIDDKPILKPKKLKTIL